VCSAQLANRRCAATRGSRLAFVLARASGPRRRGCLCPRAATRAEASALAEMAASRRKRQRRERARAVVGVLLVRGSSTALRPARRASVCSRAGARRGCSASAGESKSPSNSGARRVQLVPRERHPGVIEVVASWPCGSLGHGVSFHARQRLPPDRRSLQHNPRLIARRQPVSRRRRGIR
jgi:hypothetical protein